MKIGINYRAIAVGDENDFIGFGLVIIQNMKNY